MEISNKVSLITGGASGLGLATAEVLIESGSKVMLLDLNEDNAKSAVEKLGSNSSYVIANVTDEASVQSAIDKTVEEFEGLHVVVNCAGIGSASKTVGKDGAHPLDYFKTVVDINLNGTFNVLRLAAVAMGSNEPNDDGECGVIINPPRHSSTIPDDTRFMKFSKSSVSQSVSDHLQPRRYFWSISSPSSFLASSLERPVRAP